jgi:hypothetical protein
MDSCLKEYFLKSSLIGVNVSSVFMEMAYGFLNCCRQEALPFKYLGLPMEANSSKVATWKVLIKKIKE